jgi:pimeloyl-ACP methyl ester carboxylesterase
MIRGGRPALGLVVAALVLTACSSESPASDLPSSPTVGSAPAVEDTPALSCEGSGGPTVVLEPGLDTGGDTFTLLALLLSRHHRVCSHTRPGTRDRAPVSGSASSAQGAADLADALEAAGETPPYVLVGWSYGGVVVQAFANANPDLVAGVVLEDSSQPEQLGDPAFGLDHLTDGGNPVDLDASAASLRGLSLGKLPLIVLSSDELSGGLRTKWYAYHRAQAALSSQGQHVRAVGSGHAIHEQATALEATAIELVTTAARDGSRLPPCGASLTRHHGRCLG